MRIGLYQNEYGRNEFYKEFKCCEINLDEMTIGADYSVATDAPQDTVYGIPVKGYAFSFTASGARKIEGKSKTKKDLLMRGPYWTWDDTLSKRNFMNEKGTFVSHTFEYKPDDWDSEVYWKYYTYTTDNNWEQYQNANTTFNPGVTYYTCNDWDHEPQKIFYAKNNLATSFVIGQFLGDGPTVSGSGACVAGWTSGAGIGSGATRTGHTRFLGMKNPEEEYVDFSTGFRNYPMVNQINLRQLGTWVLTANPEHQLNLQIFWQIAHIIYNDKEYIGWGIIRYDIEDPSTVVEAKFACVNIECFADAVVPEPKAHGQGIDPGNDGSHGTGNGLPDGDDMVPTGLHGGISAFTGTNGVGLHQYIIDMTNLGELQDVLWDPGNNLWDKFKESNYNPMAGILGLFMIPEQLIPDVLTSSTNVRIAGEVCDGNDLQQVVADCVNPTQNITKPIVYELDSPDYVFDLGEDIVPYKTFADFARTSVYIHIPFCGAAQIDPDQCVNGNIEVYYYCDTITGNVCAQVLTHDSRGKSHIASVLTGNCAYTQPLVGSDNQSTATLMSGLTNFGGSVIASVVTGNPTSAIVSGAQFGISAATAKNNTVTVGNPTGNAGWLGFRSFKIDVTWGRYIKTDGSYADVNGRPSCDDKLIVNDFEGYLEMKVNANGISYASDEEKQEIKELLETGIFVNNPNS